jgi:hypothetical protein
VALASGTRIGPYEITGAIGAGGMGEVYRATDTSLKRAVAIKVLPEAMAADVERLARFQREAEVLAALNHPNIAAIHGFERSGPVTALVMELVDGPTLADRIAQGALPVDEALPIAKQIAEALEAAHERGIIHRDLKPANIKVRPDGTVKVLDFGLAKATEPAAASGVSSLGMSQSPTITTPAMTQLGMILGTAAYMSPEQARGRPVDKRADIWAFGCVLFEMLTGTRAFPGEDVTDTLATVVKLEPNWTLLPAGVPPRVRQALRVCLQKDPRQRGGDIAAIQLALEGVFEAHGTGTAPASTGIGPASWRPIAAAAVASALVAGVAGWMLRTPAPQEAGRVVRFQVSPPAAGAFVGASNVPRMDVSPDGQYIAFTANLRDGRPDQLFVRRLEAVGATALTNVTEVLAEPVQQPFWSPDSRFIGFFLNGTLRRVAVTGGPSQTLTSMPGQNYGGAWNSQGTILFGSSLTKGLLRISADGGVPLQVTTLDASAKEAAHLWPQFLPDGRHFLYWAAGSEPAIYVGSLDSPERRLVMRTASMARYVPPGYLLFVRETALLAQPFDPATLELRGNPVLVADSVQVAGNGRAGFAVSATGVLVFREATGSLSSDSQLMWKDRDGVEQRVIGEAGIYRGVELSADDRLVAFHREIPPSSAGDIWIVDTDRGATARFTFDPERHNYAPVWTPDGRQLVFAKQLAGERRQSAIFVRDASGAGDERILYESSDGGFAIPSDVSPDGSTLLFSAGSALWTLSLAGSGSPTLFVEAPGVQQFARFSPDGRWVAYTSGESGRQEVFVRSFPKPDSRFQVSTAGGSRPRWRRDGRELYYLGGPAADGLPLMAVTVENSGGGLRFATPQMLFAFEPALTHGGGATTLYAPTADGTRFVVVQAGTSDEDPAQQPLTVVLNWLELLRGETSSN